MRWWFKRRGPAPADPAAILRELPLFAELGDEALGGLIGGERPFVAGDALFREGEPGDDLYLLADGRVELLRGGRRLAVCERLAFVGLPAALGRPHSLSAAALDAGRAIAIPRAGLEALATSDPELSNRLLLALSRDLAARLRAADDQVIGQLHAWSIYR